MTTTSPATSPATSPSTTLVLAPPIYRAPLRGAVRRLASTVATPTSPESSRAVAAGPLPVAVLRPHEDVAALLTRLYATRVRGHGDVHVLQLTPEHVCDVGAELAVAGRLFGDTVHHRDLTPGAPDDPVPGGPPRPGTGPFVLSVRRPRIDGTALRTLRGGRAVVLAVDTARSRRRAVVDALDMLDGLGLAVRGLVVWRGRLPPDPAWGSRRRAD